MKAVLDWLDHRTGYRELMHEALYERVPGGARWRYVWGSTLVFTFSVQMITGFFLWTAYSPSAQTAWESVYYIEHVMQFGNVVRGIHHFTAQAMIVLMALHLMQVIIDGAYKAPREVNFWLGLILMLIVLGLSLTGYLLPWDQKGYWATQVATNIAGGTPVVGTEVQKMAVGGDVYGHLTLTRFFALHAGLLPFLLIAFLVVHIAAFRRHGITVPDPKRRPPVYFWPDQVLKDAVACLAILATVLVLVFWKGAELGAPADPSENYSAARPEWYFLFLFQLLKYFEGKYELIGTMVIPGIVMTVLFLMPFIAKIRGGHAFNLGFISILLACCLGLTIVASKTDSDDPKYQAAVAEAKRNAERAVELAQGPQGIGREGALPLLRNDPFIQGPKLFAKHCATCHRYDGKDGTGRDVLAKEDGQEVIAKPSATDLGNFGSREWMKAVLTDFATLLKDTEYASWEGKPLGKHFTDPKRRMAGWAAEHGAKLKPDEIENLVEFMVAQTGRELKPALDPKKVDAGRTFFLENDNACGNCHAMSEAKKDGPLEEIASGDGGAPDLTGYGSDSWLKGFIKDPGTEKFYSKRNRMPGFGDRLSEKELQMLVDWMRHQWYEPKSQEENAKSE
ncbi:MAG: qcrB [Planctomycetaceae bacterium]|nr:qcrB [Planctomycetaceae bacterium]